MQILRKAGGKPNHLVRLNWYLTDKAEYVARQKEVGEVYRRVIGRHFPAMTLLIVTGLLEAGAKVEIEATRRHSKIIIRLVKIPVGGSQFRTSSNHVLFIGDRESNRWRILEPTEVMRRSAPIRETYYGLQSFAYLSALFVSTFSTISVWNLPSARFATFVK